MNNFWKPQLLASPNIPRPLHTVNPRSICGRFWWDNQRRKAYSKYEFRCYACGVPKKHAKYFKHLEAHEEYDIDWETGRVELKEIVALCHSCHNFIHNGRLWAIYKNGEIDRSKVVDIITSGLDICKRNNVQPYYGAYQTKYLLNGCSEKVAIERAKNKGWFPKTTAPWDKWHLIIEGHKYYSPFKNQQDWENYWKR